MNANKHIKEVKFIKKVWRQMKINYPFTNNCRLVTDEQYWGYSGCYSRNDKTIQVWIHRLIKQYSYDKDNKIQYNKPKSLNEILVKVLLHELRHHYQHENKILCDNPSVGKTRKLHMKLPQEQDANRWANKEWKKTWRTFTNTLQLDVKINSSSLSGGEGTHLS